jgi:trehalose synthase
MVRTLLAYARGAGVDARWAVIQGPPEFFRLTKRLHNALHGSRGDGSPLGEAERKLYEQVNQQNAADLAPLVSPRDVVLVHDPQPAGMINALLRRGALVVWRCHIGHDHPNAEVERAWDFLAPQVRDARAYVFTRMSYVPRQLDARRAVAIPPSIDPFSAKNQSLDEGAIEAILSQIGVVAAQVDPTCARFLREDGTPARVDRRAEIVRIGPAPTLDVPLVVQVSRWDRLKDPTGVLEGFTRLSAKTPTAQLVLAGPDVTSVADDPEGAQVYRSVVEAWHRLEPAWRARVQLVSLPTLDVEENAAMVNALQRHATVVVQKSLYEGFGLTVSEAMWKRRPVVASAVGGICDQIENGKTGLLIEDPRDLDAFAAAVGRLLLDDALAERLAEAGRERVFERYLGINSLLRYGALLEALDRGALVGLAASL